MVRWRILWFLMPAGLWTLPACSDDEATDGGGSGGQPAGQSSGGGAGGPEGGASGAGTSGTAAGGSAANAGVGSGQNAGNGGGVNPQGGTSPSGGSAGSTSADPNVLVSDPAAGITAGLVLDAGYLYWRSGTHAIARATTAGTGAEVLFTRPGDEASTVAIGGIAVANGYVYFTDTGERDRVTVGVYKLPITGGTATKVADGMQPYNIATQGDEICFTDNTDLKHVTTAGGPVTTLVTGAVSYRSELMMSGGYCYFPATLGASAEDLYRVPLPVAEGGEGGAPGAAGAGGGESTPERVSVVSGRAEILLAPQVDQGYVYWGAGDSIYRWTPGAAGDPMAVGDVYDPLRPMDTSPPRSVLFPKDGTLYWVGGQSTLFQQMLPDGEREVLSVRGASSIVVDAAYVYGTAGANITRYAR